MMTENEVKITEQIREAVKSDFENVFDKPLQEVKVTEKTRETVIRYPDLHRGSIRFCTGDFYTDKEFEKERREVDAIELP